MNKKNYVHKHFFDISEERIKKTLDLYYFFKNIKKVANELKTSKYQVYCLLILGNISFKKRGREKLADYEY